MCSTHWHTAACIVNATECLLFDCYGKILWQKLRSRDSITLVDVAPRTRVWFHEALGSLLENKIISNLASYSMLSPMVLSMKPSMELFHKHLWVEQWFIQMEINRNQLSHGNALRCQVNDSYPIPHYNPSELRVPKYMHCSADKNHHMFQEVEFLFSSMPILTAGRHLTSSPSKKRVGHRCTKC